MWCRPHNPSPPSAFEPHASFRDYAYSRGMGQSPDLVSAYISLVTREEKHWSDLRFDSPNEAMGEWSLQFHPQATTVHYNQVTIESTDAWQLSISGTFKALEIAGLTAWNIHFNPDSCNQPIRFVNCVIGKLILINKTNNAYRPSLELQHCWIGTLVLPTECTKNLTIEGGGIANIDCPPADSPNPFKGAVIFKDVFFPTTVKQTGLFEGSQAYRSLHSHLKKHDNIPAANLMRALQLRSERTDDQGFTRLTNWTYGTFAEYGTSPGRPLLWLLGLYLFTCALLYFFDQGMVNPELKYVGANAILLDENGGRMTRSALLPLHSLVNPFGIFFDSRKLIIPATPPGSILLTIQGLCSDLLVLMTVLSIRRRFKAE